MKLSRYIINPFTLAVTYLVMGALWVVYSDNIVATIIDNTELITRYQTVKGIFFVILSSILFYLLAKMSESSLLSVSKELDREEVKLKRLSDTSPTGIIFIDPNGHIRFVNPMAEKLFNMSSDNLLSRKIEELGLHIATDKGEEVPSKDLSFNVVLRTKKAISGVRYRIGKEGHYQYLSSNASPIFLENNVLDGVLCTTIDITDVIESENIIQEHEERYKLLVDESPFAVIIHQNNIIQYVNPMGVKLFEVESKKQVIGLNIMDIIHPDFIDVTIERELKMQKGEEVHYPFELKIKNIKGNIIPVEIISIPFKTGNTIAVQIIAIDISERLEKERILNENLNEKTVMLSEIHHRVKNNMAIISGLLQLEAFELRNEMLQSILFDSVARIKSISLIHEQVYESNNLATIRLDKNIEQLIKTISANYSNKSKIEIEFRLQPTVLNINQAVPCALFLNEVMTNIYKHTAQYVNGEKCIIYCNDIDEFVSLTFKIVGEQSFKESFKADNTKLSTQLIQLMAQQVHGNLKIEEVNNELLIELNFDKSKKTKGSAQSNAF